MDSKQNSLDDTDRKLLNLLQKDARLSVRQLAFELHLTPTPVHERLKRLERSGLIKAYTVHIDREKAGITLVVHCAVSLQAHEISSIDRFEKAIAAMPEVRTCHHVSGDSDYLLEIWAKDMDDYRQFLRSKLSSAPNVGKVKSLFVMKEVKRSEAFGF